MRDLRNFGDLPLDPEVQALARKLVDAELGDVGLPMHRVNVAIGAAHILNEDTLARALTLFEPDATLDAALDAAEIAMSLRLCIDKHAEALRFRPWAQRVLVHAAEALEGAAYANDIACALASVASEVR